ncbi:MAG: AAA family ATPase [Selenomonadaceae bacterium]|nr:AAA family ATPase [Selenomonadaceae bacterium]
MQFYIGTENFVHGKNILTLNFDGKILVVSNENRQMNFSEITPSQAKQILLQAENQNIISHHEAWIQNNLRGLENFSFDYFDTENFKIEEFLFDTENFSLENKIQDCGTYYKISAKNISDALQSAKNFCAELYKNKRLASRCAKYISEVKENCTEDFNIENIFRQSAGGAVIIDSEKNFFGELIEKFSGEVIFIFIETDKNFFRKNDSYKILQNMVGLHEIKNILNQILDNFEIQKLRENFGLKNFKMSLHMIFTGNPGTAKTTAARLSAEILSDGKFIETGRADLVGKYVGWTAKNIEKIFDKARGGVLFIDEAYSLTDENFGGEAINEIVRQMEIFRDEIIVIFAGYPDKMKIFLDGNEGLKSRIAFHVDFPDYNVDELIEIFKFMTAEKNFEIDNEVLKKCRKIFSEIIKQKNFGNGRFVRNFLERGILRQSQRILRGNKKIGREELIQLKPEDFEINLLPAEKNFIGFSPRG